MPTFPKWLHRSRTAQIKAVSAGQRRESEPVSLSSATGSGPGPGFGSTWITARSQSLAVPSVSQTSDGRRRRSSSSSNADLGLQILYQPEFISVDIIFVHGLGGHRQKTWSKNYDSDLFWPEMWLPYEPGMDSARILTFGYDASLHASTRADCNILDFAKTLLVEMKTAYGWADEPLGLGTRPIVFVVHSMGGLVVKKVLLLGQQDEAYRDMVESISAIIFLSTPHRGTNFAETLNRILSATFQSSKKYIADLKQNSPMIEEINESFRHIAPRLAIWSFYETLETTVGPRKIMVLKKDSSTLGYPNEISRPLNADHHGVCKYASRIDNNYISVRNAIKSLVSPFRNKNARQRDTHRNLLDGPRVETLFRDCPSSENDYNMLRRQLVPGTGQWFLQLPEIADWLQPQPASRIVWYHAPPGSGKSGLAVHLISHLKEQSSAGRLHCQYFLFKYADTAKCSVYNCLRALAAQLARDLPAFQQLLATSSAQNLGLGSFDPLLVWQNVFENCFFQLPGPTLPIYWVIDALDECAAPRSLLALLQSLAASRLPVQVLLLSRHTGAMASDVDRLSSHVPVTQLSADSADHQEHAKQDIRLLVQQEIKHMPGSESFKAELLEKITRRSEGNMLWTKLVLDEVSQCHVEDDINGVLEEVPDDMALLYQRMERNLVAPTRKSNVPLTRALLMWTTCAQRALSLPELSGALQPTFHDFIDLRNTIQNTCGQFIQVDDKGFVTIFHHTAREYFTHSCQSQFYLEPRRTSELLFAKTLAVLQDEDLRWRLKKYQYVLQAREPFVFYAAVSWPYHFGHIHATTADTHVLDTLLRFLHSPHVLTWIHALALQRRLEVLVRASKVLAIFTDMSNKSNESSNPMLHRIADLEYIDSWATNLLKLAGTFGHNIITDPDILYNLIPALCPADSVIRKQFYHPQSSRIQLSGHNTPGWTDRLGRFVLPDGIDAWKLSCAGKLVAVLGSKRVLNVSDSVTFSDVCTIPLDQVALTLALNTNGSRLATYGLASTQLWAIPSAKLLSTTPNPPHIKALAFAFADNDRRLVAVGNDNVVRHIQLDDVESRSLGWQVPYPNMLHQTRRIHGAVAGSPDCVAFNGDKTLVGVSYRGAPLSVWNMEDGQLVGRKKRSRAFPTTSASRTSGNLVGVVNWVPAKRFAWNERTGHIVGIHKDSSVFKWHPVTDTHEDSRQTADEIAVSPNGLFFATSSSNGSIQVWNHKFFTVIYRLPSEGLVTELAFSPDSQRFYDIRGRWVNAWGPACLSRSLDHDEHVSDSNSDEHSIETSTGSGTGSGLSEEQVLEVNAVTALAPSPDGQSYAAAFSNGLCMLFPDIQADGTACAQFYEYIEVPHTVWSPDGRLVVAADTAGDIKISRVPQYTAAQRPDMVPQTCFHIKPSYDNISQLLFSPDSKYLFVTTGRNAFVCSVEDGAFTGHIELPDKKRKWILHPVQNLLMSFGTSDVSVYRWDGLACVGTYSYDAAQGAEEKGKECAHAPSALDELLGDASTSRVDKVMLTQDGKHILLSCSTTPVAKEDVAGEKLDAVEPAKGQTWLAFPGPACATASLAPDFPSDYLRIPAEVASLIKVPLGILPSRQIVFFDHNLWLCSYPLDIPVQDDVEEWLRKFYFIPRDWVSTSSLRLCSISDEGTLFWPRDGFVEVVECNAINETKIM